MPTLAAKLLRAGVARNDYLRIAMVLSLCIHASVLALRFSIAPQPRAEVSTLEVALVNAHSENAPIKPAILAQQQLDGGGDNAGGVAASPLPRTSLQSADEIVLAALRKRQEELEAQQQHLYEQLQSLQFTAPGRQASDSPTGAHDPGHDDEDQESVILNAQISALKERIERYNAQPRRQFTAPSAQSADYAEYVENWRKKIELIGTEHYPDQARGKVYGSLQLTVYIRKDGTLEHVEIDRPSQHAILNLAAQRIVQLAAPFSPLPPAISKDADVLAITRTWRFVNNQLDTETP